MWQLEQKTMTISQAFDKSYELWKAAFKTEISLLAMFCVWSGIVFVVMEIILPNYLPVDLHDLATFHSSIAAIVVSAIYLLSFFIVYAAVFSRLQYFNSNNGRELGVMQSLHIGVKKLPIFVTALIIALVTNLLSYAGLLYQHHYYLAALVLAIPGIYLIPVFNIYYALIAIEGLGPFAAYKRALQLIWRNWWRTAILLSIPFLLSLLLMFVAYTAFSIFLISTDLGELANFLLFIAMQMICTTLYVSGAVVVSFVQVYNLRARRGEQLPAKSEVNFKTING